MKSAGVEILSQLKTSGFLPHWYEVAQADHFWMKGRFDFLKEAFQKLGWSLTSPLKVLDVGSGNGALRQQIESATSWGVDCADIDRTALESLSASRGRRLFYDITDENPELTGQYDLVFLQDVVEHIEKPEPFLKSALAHLKIGGSLVINVPAFQSLFSRYDTCAGHYRRYTAASLTRELSPLAVQPLYRAYWGLCLLPLLVVRKFLLAMIQSEEKVISIGFQPKFLWMDRMLRGLLKLERNLWPARFVGTSLIMIFKRVN